MKTLAYFPQTEGASAAPPPPPNTVESIARYGYAVFAWRRPHSVIATQSIFTLELRIGFNNNVKEWGWIALWFLYLAVEGVMTAH